MPALSLMARSVALVSALHEASHFGATTAALIMHSFSAERAGFGAYCECAALFGGETGQGEVICLGQPEGVRLLCGWAQGAGAGRPQHRA